MTRVYCIYNDVPDCAAPYLRRPWSKFIPFEKALKPNAADLNYFTVFVYLVLMNLMKLGFEFHTDIGVMVDYEVTSRQFLVRLSS
jgi:hypothetical protein